MLVRERDVRSAFWREYFKSAKPAKYRGRDQNELPADVRTMFVNYVDHLARDGQISDRLAQRVTL